MHNEEGKGELDGYKTICEISDDIREMKFEKKKSCEFYKLMQNIMGLL